MAEKNTFSTGTEKKKKKGKSQAPVALVYFITFTVVLLIIGGVSLFVMERFVLKDDSSTASTSSDDSPKTSDNTTKFYLLQSDSGELEMTMLERFLPKSKEIVLLPLSSKTASADGQTLAALYESGGSSEVKSAVEEILDITVDNYIVLSHENFENLIDNIATISYTVPEDMYYVDQNSDDVTNYQKGEELTLFGSELRLFLTYPEYADGAQQNVKVCGELISQVINQGLSTTLTVQNLSSTFNTMVKNSEDKDFSLNDFTDRTQTLIEYIADNSNEPANYITATGSWNDDETVFTVSDEFPEQLKNLFEL